MITEINTLRRYNVVKANDLIQKSRFSLSTQEQKAILYIISKIKPSDTELVEQIFDISEFCRVCGLDASNGANYKYIKNTLKGLRDKSIWLTLPDGSETTLSWINKVTVSKSSGKVKIKLDDDMKPYLLQLGQRFSQYELIYTLAMKSQYAIRIYEILKSYQFRKKITFDIEEFKKIIDAEKYVNFKDFRVKVIEIALREISAYSDILVNYVPIKEGKRVAYIEFEISLKRDLDDIINTRQNIYQKLESVKTPNYDNEEYCLNQ